MKSATFPEFNLRVIFGLNLYSSKRKSFEIFLAKDFPKTQVCVKVVKVKCYVNPFDWSHEVMAKNNNAFLFSMPSPDWISLGFGDAPT